MTSPGFGIFVLFFGIAVLDAIGSGNLPRIAFWVAVGVLFWVLERRRPLRH